MPELPKQVMCWYGQWPLAHAGTWATTRYPDDAVPYVPKSDFDRIKAAAELGLAMAEANDLWKTAETIREALEAPEPTHISGWGCCWERCTEGERLMPIVYLIPAAALWLMCAIIWAVGAPWWIDYPVFGLACAATALGGFMAYISAGTRW